METKKKRVLSAIQPTSVMHIGNYFGAIANWVKLQNDYECIYGVVDLHAMTMPYNPKELRANTNNMIIDLLACGIDPEKSILFVQSMVPEHTELSWILNCVTSYGELTRMTQFKDKSDLLQSGAKENFISSGLFTYPVLQAADILIYRAAYVPVGKDQEQHLELSRNIAVRFNNQFKKCFPIPEPLFTSIPKLMSLADPTKKMSKSLGPKHYIALFEEENVLNKKVRSAVTDTGGEASSEMSPGVKNLFEILKALNQNELVDNLTTDFKNGELKYKDLKEAVSEALINFIRPLRNKREEIAADKAYVENVIKTGSEKARAIARKTLDDARERAGLPKFNL